MKIQNIKKTKYEQVTEILEKQGYITNSEAVKIFGIEEDVYRVIEHVRIWKKFQKVLKLRLNFPIINSTN